MSGYAVVAQYYDALAAEGHALVDAQIAAALRGLETQHGPVVDIGAGTGLTTRVIADALPDAEILAIEPDASMRCGLMTRLWCDTELRRRVTILPLPALEVALPDVISGVVASASLVHFSAEERQRLWTMLARRLAARGRIIAEIQCPEAVDVPERLMASATVGRVEYQGWAQARAVGPDSQLWRMTYRATTDGVETSRHVTAFVCWTASARQVAAEAVRAGLVAEPVGDLVVMCPEK